MVPGLAEGIDKPVLCSFMGIVDVSEGVEYLENNGIPNYPFPEAAVRAMASMASFGSRCLPRREAGPPRGCGPRRPAQVIRSKLGDRDALDARERGQRDPPVSTASRCLKSRLLRDPERSRPRPRRSARPWP